MKLVGYVGSREGGERREHMGRVCGLAEEACSQRAAWGNDSGWIRIRLVNTYYIHTCMHVR